MNTKNDLHWGGVDVYNDRETGERVLVYSAKLNLDGERSVRLYREDRWAKDLAIWDPNNTMTHRAYWFGKREDRQPAFSTQERCIEAAEKQLALVA